MAASERHQAGRGAVLSEIQARESVATLTQRELETVRLLSMGLSTKDAADKMCVTIHTVRAHLKAAARKTGTRSRVALLRIFSKNSGQG